MEGKEKKKQPKHKDNNLRGLSCQPPLAEFLARTLLLFLQNR